MSASPQVGAAMCQPLAGRAVRWLLAVAAGSGVATLVLILVQVKDVPLPPRTKYGLVLDAGSSHTTLYVYQWPAGKENGTGIVSQAAACTVPGPGISSYADDPTGAGASLRACLDTAMTLIPAKQQRETPAYLGATAGMRLLREQNSTKADLVFAEVSRTIRQYPVAFQGAQILTGNEEGSFGWITINYLLETLGKFSFTGVWTHPGQPLSGTWCPRPRLLVQESQTLGFNGVYQPPAHGQFFAFSGFYSVFHFLNLTSGQPLSDVQATVERFCAKEWREVQAMRPALNKTRLQDYCGASTYILTLLLQGYKFSNQTWSNIQFRQQVAAVDVGWSLGYMLNLTNAVPTEAPERVKGQRPGSPSLPDAGPAPLVQPGSVLPEALCHLRDDAVALGQGPAVGRSQAASSGHRAGPGAVPWAARWPRELLGRGWEWQV
nr:ectonucleoside triphosphate diphosphohydrolase 8-like [Pelodiscus sinensis]|eukprot:XP_006117431.1 ectonucleoside triphosphate diphosphohydrolase 8-like [Pelodiscus sinensis]